MGDGSDPTPFDDDAPEPLEDLVTNDVVWDYYWLERFQLPPDVVDRQDEVRMNRIRDFDRQTNWQRWYNRHVDNEAADTSFDNVADYHSVLGAVR